MDLSQGHLQKCWPETEERDFWEGPLLCDKATGKVQGKDGAVQTGPLASDRRQYKKEYQGEA